jgi:hypothetical protein
MLNKVNHKVVKPYKIKEQALNARAVGTIYYITPKDPKTANDAADFGFCV